MALRWGILATGGIAERFTSDLQLNGLTVTAVGSRSKQKAQAFASRFGIANAYGSYDELVEAPEVDAIYIATPHPFHASAGELAIRAGKHALIEKPFTVSAREAQHLAGLATHSGVVLMEAMWTRFLPHIVKLREILTTGALGRIRNVSAAHHQVLPEDPSHRLNNLALGGGALLDLGVYPISLAHLLLGEPDSILASGRLKPTGVDAEVSAILRYNSGAAAVLSAASDAAGATRAEINCTNGYIEIAGPWYERSALSVYNSEGELLESFETAPLNGRGMHLQAAELERVVESGEASSPHMTPQDSVAVMATMDEIRRQIGVIYPGE